MTAFGSIKPDPKLWQDRGLRSAIGGYAPRDQGKKLPKHVVRNFKKRIKDHLVQDPDRKGRVIYDALLKDNEIPLRECGELLTLSAFYRYVVVCRDELNEGN